MPYKPDYEQAMRQALDIADQALPLDVPVGAILLDKKTGAVLATGFNTRERDASPLGHAEVNAILAASQKQGNWRLDETLLVVTLEPCPMCAALIAQARIPVVVFGAWDSLQGACGGKLALLQTLAPTTQVYGGILELDCQTRLKAFFTAKRTPH